MMNEHRPTIQKRTGLAARLGGALSVVALAGCIIQSPVVPAPAPLARTNAVVRSLPAISQQLAFAAPTAPGSTVTGMFNITPSPSPAVVGYRLWWGTATANYTNSFDAKTNLTVALPLERGVKYFAAATAYDQAGHYSPFSAEVTFPAPITNYVTPFIRFSETPNGPWAIYWSQTFTNPPGTSGFFQLGIQGTNSGSIVRLDARTLQVSNTNSP